jgi:hypothetical protein
MQGKYIGVAQGITADDTAGNQYFNFEVKNNRRAGKI